MRLCLAKEAFPFLIPLVGLAGVVTFLGKAWMAAFLLALAGGVGLFFRDPERRAPQGKELILSPADGKVVAVEPCRGALGEELTQVSIFLALWDVHINRAPTAAVVQEVSYHPGRFRVAFAKEASRENEQNLVRFSSPHGDLWVKQVAGFLARRIVCWVKPGQKVEAGERIGMIRFGSRVDLLLPSWVSLWVRVGDRVKGGVTVIGMKAATPHPEQAA